MGSEPATIGHVLHRLHRAGAEVLAADLARALGDRYRFVFLCLDEVGELGEQLRSEGFEVVKIGRRPGVDRRVARRLRLAVTDHRIHLLHAHQYTPFFYSALSRRFASRPCVLFTEHGRHYPDPRKWRRVFANQLLLRPHDRVTAVGRFVKQALVDNEGIPAERIEVIYNGVQPADPAAADRAEARRRMGVGPADLVVAQVARFHPVKDHATAIRAFAHVALRVPRARLVLIGDGELRAQTEQLVNELGIASSVSFLGVRDDVPALLAGVDLFVLSSLSEGISVTLLEAMAAGVAICATRVGGNPEVVDHGRNGLLSPRGDHPALADNLVTLLTNPHLRAAMGEAGRLRLRRRFSQDHMHRAYADVYRAMLHDA